MTNLGWSKVLALTGGLLLAGSTALQAAPPEPLVIQLDLVQNGPAGKERSRRAERYLIALGQHRPGEVSTEAPPHVRTEVRLRLDGEGLSFDVLRIDPERIVCSARGLTPVPAPGRQQLVARVPCDGGGELEVLLSTVPPATGR
jgi:hypothetical protein